MKNLCVLLTLSSVLIISECNPDVWNVDRCDRGCSDKKKCPKNSECQNIQNSNCGVCVCVDGYKPQGNSCVVDKTKSKTTTPKSKSKTTKSGRGSAEETTTAAITTLTTTAASTSTSKTSKTPTTPTSSASTTSTTSTTTKTTTGVPTQGPPPAPITLDCSTLDCGVALEQGNGSDPLSVRTQKFGTPPPGCARQLQHGQVVCKSPLTTGDPFCYGAYCLPVGDSKSYCICNFDKSGPSCQEDKQGKCSDGTGETPANGFLSTGKRYINQQNPDTGSIIARHFTATLVDCIKLCQWIKGRCGSVNYGPINSQNVCELLSVETKRGNSALDAWVKDYPGWTYACCFHT